MGLSINYYGRIENGDYVTVHDFVAEYEDYSYSSQTECQVDGQSVTYEEYQKQMSVVTEGMTFTDTGYFHGTDVWEAMYQN